VILRHLPFHVPLILFARVYESPVFHVHVVIREIEVRMGEGLLEDQGVSLSAFFIDVFYPVPGEVIGDSLLGPTLHSLALQGCRGCSILPVREQVLQEAKETQREDSLILIS